MEEPVWIFIGVVGVLLGIGIIANTLFRANAEDDLTKLGAAVTMLSQECDQVCSAPENTALSVKVDLPAESVLRVRNDGVCGFMNDHPDNAKCARCSCDHNSEAIILNLTGTRQYFSSHIYNCGYTHIDTQHTARLVRLNCTG